MECLARAPSTFTAFFFRSHAPACSESSASKLHLQQQGASLCPTTLAADKKTASALSSQALVPVGGAVVTVAVLEGFGIGFPSNLRPFDSLTALVGRGKGTSNGVGADSSAAAAAAAATAASSAALSVSAPAAPTATVHAPASSRAATTTTGAFAGHHGSSSRVTTGTAISSSPFAGLSPPSTRVTSSLLVSFLVNYSVLVSDWWQFKHTARDRLLACVGSRWPLAAVVAHTSDPVKVAALAAAATAAAAAAAAAVAAASADAERFPQLQLFRQSLRGLRWGGGGSPRGGKEGGETEGDDGEASDGADGSASASGSESDGEPRVNERKWLGLLGGRSARGAAEDDAAEDAEGADAEEGGRGELASVMRDDLDPSMVWGQRRMDLDAEDTRRAFLGKPGFSFSAAGLLFPYHLGATHFLQQHGYITEHTPLAGSSAGAIVCATIASGVDPRTALHLTKHLSADCRANGTAFRLGKLLRAVLEEILPPDAHLSCNGRIRVAVTQVFGSPRGVLVDQFDSRADLIDALITSSFVPGYLEPRPATRFRNRLCVDGGLSHFMPPTASDETVRICAFPASALGLGGIGISPDLNPRESWSMRQLFSWALEPAEDDFLDELFDCGYQDAQSWALTYQRALQPQPLHAPDLLSLSLPLSGAAAGGVAQGGALNAGNGAAAA
ncbi:hypothetical protein CLOM_g11193 [Closterium sp. NIES-68]|nr:hypothetical protein CLOM_g11193 [Closterium sp. NIES-68]GJP80114.1 hypothetical protein CLOP_g10344 [Closterium sp. NIES-67]